MLPDPKTGWCILKDKGGHAGNDHEHAVIRRWTAPRDLVLSVTGRLKHPSDQGDGVQSRIVSSRTGTAGEWVAQKSETDTNVARLEVKRGDTIDFVTDCRSNSSHDSFEWTVTLRAEQSSDGGGQQWSSADGFRGPLPVPLGPWERYAQVLLLSNELVCVD